MSEPRLSSATRGALTTVGLLVVVALLWMLRELLLLVGFAALLAYALDPLVRLLERVRLGPRQLPRHAAAMLVMLIVAGVLAWALVVGLPQLAREAGRFAERAPAALARLLDLLRAEAGARGLTAMLGPLGGATPMTAAELIASASVPVLRTLGRVFDLGQLVGLVLVPVLAFYLLAEHAAVEASALRFLPEDARPRAQKALTAVERALRSYVRGQGVVCAFMGALTGAALALIGLPGAILLGTIVAFAEVLPIVGFWTASAAIVLTGWSTAHPMTALYGWTAYLVINQIVGLFVTPRVMGQHMRMHPFVVMVSILAGGVLLGAAGAILALPLAAALQSLIAEFALRPARRAGDRPASS